MSEDVLHTRLRRFAKSPNEISWGTRASGPESTNAVRPLRVKHANQAVMGTLRILCGVVFRSQFSQHG